MKLDFPKKIEAAYAGVLNGLVTDIEKKFKEIYLGDYKANSVDEVKINASDRANTLIEYMNRNDEGLKRQMRASKINENDEKSVEFLEYFEEVLTDEYCFELAADYVLDAVEFAIKQTEDQMVEILGVDYTKQPFYDESAIEKVLDDNIQLIKAEPEKYLRSYDKQLKKILKEKDIKGETLDDITTAIQKATGIERNRANLIARDQIGNIYADSTKRQYEGIGLKTFRWVTVGDKRVRPEHKERNGEVFEWDNPPDGEIPSQPIACRCIGAVVKEEVLAL